LLTLMAVDLVTGQPRNVTFAGMALWAATGSLPRTTEAAWPGARAARATLLAAEQAALARRGAAVQMEVLLAQLQPGDRYWWCSHVCELVGVHGDPALAPRYVVCRHVLTQHLRGGMVTAPAQQRVQRATCGAV
jgi:hypothetical protein